MLRYEICYNVANLETKKNINVWFARAIEFEKWPYFLDPVVYLIIASGRALRLVASCRSKYMYLPQKM